MYCKTNWMCSIDCHSSTACENAYMYFHENSGGMIRYQSWIPDPTQSPTPRPTTPPTQETTKSYWFITFWHPMIICSFNQSCTVICNAHCEGSTIICPEDAPCDVQCNGWGGCRNAEIQWPIIPGYGHLTCTGYFACVNVTFPKANPTQALSISCTGNYFTCQLATMYCPTSANCTLHCGGTDAAASCASVCI